MSFNSETKRKKVFSVNAINSLLDKQKKELQKMVDEIKKKHLVRVPSQKESIMDLVKNAKKEGFNLTYLPENKNFVLAKKNLYKSPNKRTEDNLDSIDILNRSFEGNSPDDGKKVNGSDGVFYHMGKNENIKKLK